MARLERAHELLAARERVLRGEVGALEVVQHEEGEPLADERVDDGAERGEGARAHAEAAHHLGRVGAPSIIEGAARGDRREEQRARAAAVAHDHHERRVRLVEVREVMKGGQLIERAEIGDRRARAEGEDDAVAYPRGERVAPRGVLRGGYLSERGVCSGER